MMVRNIGKKDRLIRLIIALILLALAILYSSWLILIGSLFVFFEALASWCVIYQFLGKNTCSIKTDYKNKKE